MFYNILGIKCYVLYQYGEVFSYFEQSFRVMKVFDNKEREKIIYYNLVIVYEVFGQILDVIQYYEKEFNIIKIYFGKKLEEVLCSKFSSFYEVFGQYEMLISYGEKVLEISKVFGDKLRIGKVYELFGIVYYFIC